MSLRHVPLLVVVLAGCTAASPGSDRQASGGSGGTSQPPPPPSVASEFPIVFVSPRTEAFGELFVMNAEGDTAKRLGEEISTVEPVWSPDGAVVAYRRVIFTGTGYVSRFEVTSVDGDERVVLAADDEVTEAFERGWPHGSLAWSPDGETLAFASPRGASHLRIWLTSRFGGEPRLALPELEARHHAPSFRPGFSASLAYVAEADGTSDIWLVELERPSERQNLTLGRGPVYGSLRWSPTGDRLAFTGIDRNIEDDSGNSREIYVLALETGELTRVTDNAFDDLDPTFSPDGLRLLFSSDRDSRSPARARSSWVRSFYFVTLSDLERVEKLGLGIGGDLVEADWYWPRSGT